jgi:DNA-directed RNA polymerase subunit omega
LYKVKFILICHLPQRQDLWELESIMARITVEDCLAKVDNRFALIHLAAKRVRDLRKGGEPLVVCKNKDVVTALREIAEGKVFEEKEQKSLPWIGTEPFPLPAQLPEHAQETPSDQKEEAPESPTEVSES